MDKLSTPSNKSLLKIGRDADLASVNERPPSLQLPDDFNSDSQQNNLVINRVEEIPKTPTPAISSSNAPNDPSPKEPPYAESSEKMIAMYDYDDGKIRFNVR